MKQLGLGAMMLVVMLAASCGGGDEGNKDAAVSSDSRHADAKLLVDSQPIDGPSSDSGGPDATVADALTIDGAAADAQLTDAQSMVDGGSVTANLKVKNFLAWCSVSVNGGAASTVSEQNIVVTPGTIPLAATALAPTFKLGATPWHDTAGDLGAGEQGTVTGSGGAASSATTVVVGAGGKCVWICCPFQDGSGCPTADQCP